MSHPNLWPDFQYRINDPAYYENTTQQMLKIIRALLSLNQTGVFTAFFEYFAHTGTLDIRLYKGRWNHTKSPEARYSIDCRNEALIDCQTEETITADTLIEKMMLVVQ